MAHGNENILMPLETKRSIFRDQGAAITGLICEVDHPEKFLEPISRKAHKNDHHQSVVSVLDTDDSFTVSFFGGEFVVVNQDIGGHQDDLELPVFAGTSLGVLNVAFLSAHVVVDQNSNGHQESEYFSSWHSAPEGGFAVGEEAVVEEG
jgi:hypothetical protein